MDLRATIADMSHDHRDRRDRRRAHFNVYHPVQADLRFQPGLHDRRYRVGSGRYRLRQVNDARRRARYATSRVVVTCSSRMLQVNGGFRQAGKTT